MRPGTPARVWGLFHQFGERQATGRQHTDGGGHIREGKFAERWNLDARLAPGAGKPGPQAGLMVFHPVPGQVGLAPADGDYLGTTQAAGQLAAKGIVDVDQATRMDGNSNNRRFAAPYAAKSAW